MFTIGLIVKIADGIMRMFGYKRKLTYSDIGVTEFVVIRKSGGAKNPRRKTIATFDKIPDSSDIELLAGVGRYEVFGKRTARVYITSVNIK